MFAIKNQNEKKKKKNWATLKFIKFKILYSSSCSAERQTNPNLIFTVKTKTPKFYLQHQSQFYKSFQGQKQKTFKKHSCHNDIKNIKLFSWIILQLGIEKTSSPKRE